MNRLHSEVLAPLIEAFVGEMMSEEDPQSLSSETIDQMLKCPVIKAPITISTLLALTYVGSFVHPDPEIQSFIRANFDVMQGSFYEMYSKLCSVLWAGTAAAEWGVQPLKKKWVLQRVHSFPYGTFTFLGSKGFPETLRYHGQLELDIPYDRIIHLRNNVHLIFGTTAGLSDLESAHAAWKAWKLIISELVIAAHRLATPLTVGYVDESAISQVEKDSLGQPRYDSHGRQIMITPAEQMSAQFSNLQNRSFVVTSARNRVESLAVESDADFWVESLRIIHKLIYMSFLFPETGLEALGSGDSNLNKGHMELFRSRIKSLVSQINESLIDGPIRRIILWNYGEQATFGAFQMLEDKEDDRLGLLDAIGNLAERGFLSVEDFEVINRVRQLLGLPLQEHPESFKPREKDEPPLTFGAADLEYWRSLETRDLKTLANAVKST
jgi:hypothetical protein